MRACLAPINLEHVEAIHEHGAQTEEDYDEAFNVVDGLEDQCDILSKAVNQAEPEEELEPK